MIKKSISLSRQLESFRTVLEPSAIEYISNVESTINLMEMDVGYTAQFYDTEPGREDIQYTVTITCSVMD